MVSLNFDKIVEHMDYLQSTTEYVPLVLQTYTGVDYFDKVDDSVMLEYYRARTGLQGAKDYNKYLEDELMEWLKHHKEFEDIIK